MNHVSGIVRAIAEPYARMLPQQLASLFVPKAMQAAAQGTRQRAKMVGVVQIVGTMEAGSTRDTADRVQAMVTNDAIEKILIYANSPGGSTEGIDDLSETIHRAAQRKPVFAYCDFACSGAYYAISGATKIIVGKTATVGSIGTYILFADVSRALEQAGVDVYLIRSGPLKGTGAHGAKMSPGELEQMQRYVDSLNSHFLAAVQRGRSMSAQRLAEISDGRVWVGKEAVALGLADRAAFFADVWAELQPTPEKYGHLTGNDAYEKFNELVESKAGDSDDKAVWERADQTIRQQHPQLAFEADHYEAIYRRPRLTGSRR